MRFLATLFLLMPLLTQAQSPLPPCPSDTKVGWGNCWGSITSSNGQKYVGEFRDGKRHGQGTQTFPDGMKYVGEFRDGKYNGQGTYTFADGAKYVGEFRDGKYNGQGTYTFASGMKYVGEFRDGVRNGQGIEYRADGSVNLSGLWDAGSLKSSYALDTNRFPFNPSTTVAQPQPDAAQLERERLLAEVEAERQKRLQAEKQLAERERLVVDPVRRPPQPAINRTERRVALVIGNSSYKDSPLLNPANDAVDMEAELKRAGFQTTLVRNATLAQMREATRRFADQLPSSDVALIYFAGHGIESNRKNYLIPVSADLKFEYELVTQAYDTSEWLEMLESIKSRNADRVNIVILDACRSNTLIGSRSLGRGLGRMDAPSGTFLAYSTAPGKVAADGGRGDRNSPFTRHLLRAMQQPGIPIEDVFKEVRRNVSRETGGAQVPWESTSLTGHFSFKVR